MDEYFPQVVQAVPGENYNVYAYFTDGNIKRYNAKWMIDKGLLNDKSFREALTVLNGTVAWDLSGKYDSSDCIDKMCIRDRSLSASTHAPAPHHGRGNGQYHIRTHRGGTVDPQRFQQ